LNNSIVLYEYVKNVNIKYTGFVSFELWVINRIQNEATCLKKGEDSLAKDLSYDQVKNEGKGKLKKRGSNRNGYGQLYYILFPALIILLIFKYIPIFGNIIAFQDYNIFKGVLESPFAGLDNFRRLFSNPEFYSVLANTLIINIYKFIFCNLSSLYLKRYSYSEYKHSLKNSVICVRVIFIYHVKYFLKVC